MWLFWQALPGILSVALQKQIGTPDVERAEAWFKNNGAFALRATARGTTLQTFVAASAADHDAAALMAGGGIRLRLENYLLVSFDRSGASRRWVLHP